MGPIATLFYHKKKHFSLIIFLVCLSETFVHINADFSSAEGQKFLETERDNFKSTDAFTSMTSDELSTKEIELFEKEIAYESLVKDSSKIENENPNVNSNFVNVEISSFLQGTNRDNSQSSSQSDGNNDETDGSFAPNSTSTFNGTSTNTNGNAFTSSVSETPLANVETMTSRLVTFMQIIAALFVIVLLNKKKSSLVYLKHPDEVFAMIHFKLFRKTKKPHGAEANRYCQQMLCKVSRSFSMVIMELNDELREPICIFYLVLRALDTVEDDMSIPLDVKIPILKKFHDYLDQPNFNFKDQDYGEGDERALLKGFHNVIKVFGEMKPAYQKVVKDITYRMAMGMSEFAQRDVVTVADYELYCHYVAGLVGIGLSKMFAIAGEDSRFAKMDEMSNSMGLFLQKTNITRDYLEDILEDPPRIFYPKEIWVNYTSDIKNFQHKEHREDALKCLNHMVTDAMRHIPDCLKYMSMVKDQSTFNFCAIPQVMAIATLEECYNNGKVFEGVVKIRKGLAVKLINESTSFRKVCDMFSLFVDRLEKKVVATDPNAQLMYQRIDETRVLIHEYTKNLPVEMKTQSLVSKVSTFCQTTIKT